MNHKTEKREINGTIQIRDSGIGLLTMVFVMMIIPLVGSISDISTKDQIVSMCANSDGNLVRVHRNGETEIFIVGSDGTSPTWRRIAGEMD